MERFATTSFSASKLCNIVATLFRIVPTLFQHCNAVLCLKSSLRIVSYITSPLLVKCGADHSSASLNYERFHGHPASKVEVATFYPFALKVGSKFTYIILKALVWRQQLPSVLYVCFIECIYAITSFYWCFLVAVSRYGVGYHLTLVKRESCDEDAISNLVKSHVPKAEIISAVGTEIQFVLTSESSQNFEALFSELESE